MLNQRSLVDGIMGYGYSKAKFLNWVDTESEFLQKNIDTIHEILDPWVEPDVAAPGADGSATTPVKAPAKAASNSDDFDAVFGSDGEETDVDLFGTGSSTAGNAAKVSAADAMNRIKNFDFTL
jgi:hypothetical protein